MIDMRKSTGLMALLVAAQMPAVAQETPPARPAVYGPSLVDPPGMTSGDPAPGRPEAHAPRTRRTHDRYEQAVDRWKNRQRTCLKSHKACFENQPLPSDLLTAPQPY